MAKATDFGLYAGISSVPDLSPVLNSFDQISDMCFARALSLRRQAKSKVKE